MIELVVIHDDGRKICHDIQDPGEYEVIGTEVSISFKYYRGKYKQPQSSAQHLAPSVETEVQ